MIVDGQQLPQDTTLRADLCIVGAGAAGLTLARALGRGQATVCVLEGGGFTADSRNPDLYHGSYEGNIPRFDDTYLHTTRVRGFGGTTIVWGGHCRPLEPLDFARRDWVSNSGWPLSRADLGPYYERASAVMGFPVFDRNNPDEGNERLPSQFHSGLLEERVFRFKAKRFGVDYRSEMTESRNVTVYLNSNATRIRMNAEGTAVTNLSARTRSGKRAEIRAGHYVLAAGGIENARLLLLSDSLHKKGVGNEHDQVGRYFMEHVTLEGTMGPIFVWPEIEMGLYLRHGKEDTRAQFLFPRDDVLRENRMLNCALNVRTRFTGRRLSAFDKAIMRATFNSDATDPRSAPYREPTAFSPTYICEMAPAPSNRITLTPDADALGSRKPKLTLNVSEREIQTLYRFAGMVVREVAGRRYGRAKMALLKEEVLSRVLGYHHHMGATRMHTDPKRGVVDADCRVHGVANLFVAGSSVFPTSGAANPTFTILSLALRLADLLAPKLGTG